MIYWSYSDSTVVGSATEWSLELIFEPLIGRPNSIIYMLVFLACFARATVVGVDLGHSGVKVSLISKNRTLHVAQTVDGLKVIPSYFALWNRTRSSNYSSTQSWTDKTMNEFEWAFGPTAMSQCLRFPKLCLKGFVLGNESHFNLRGYEMTALSLHSLLSSVIAEENITDEIQAVIAIPPGMKAQEKSFLYASLSVAGLLTSQFLDATVAPAHLYGLEKTLKFKNTTRIVAFVDVGAKGTRVTIFNFTSADNTTTVAQLASQFDETIGGDDLDLKLAKLIAPKYHVDLNNPKVYVNFVNDMMAVKEALSIHRSVDLKWEADDDEEETVITVTRDELNSVAKVMNETLKVLIRSALDQAKVEKVDNVELVGGCSRIPFIQEIIKEEFNVTKLGKTVNGDGAVALAAGYVAAECSNEFKVREIDRSYMLTSECALHSDNRVWRIFKAGDIDNTRSIVRLTANPGQKFVLVTDSNIPFMSFSLKNLSSPTEVEIVFVENYYLMPVPLEALAKDGTKLQMEFESVGWELSPAELGKSQTLVEKMIELQAERRVNEKVASDFEGLLLSLARMCENEETLLEEERHLIRGIVDSEMSWFQDLLSSPPTDVYRAKIAKIEKETKEFVDRVKEVSARAIALKKLAKTTSKSEKVLADLEANPLSQDESLLRQLTFKIKEAKRILTDEAIDSIGFIQCREALKEVLRSTNKQEPVIAGEL